VKAKSTGKVKVLAVFLGLSLTSAKTQGQASLQSIFIRSDPIKCFTVLSRKRERGRKRERERERELTKVQFMLIFLSVQFFAKGNGIIQVNKALESPAKTKKWTF